MAVIPLYVNKLAAKTTLSDGDLVIVGEGDDAKKMTIAQLKEQLGINALNTKSDKILVDRPVITQSPLNGSTIGIYAERVVTGLQNFAEVRMLVAVGDAALQWLTFDTHQATQTVTTYYSERYAASAEFKCDLSSGSIGVKVRSATGWPANQCGIRMVIGILTKN